MIRQTGFWIASLCALFLFPANAISADADAATANTCVTCHEDVKWFVQNKKIYNYYQDWLTSPHKLAGVVCNDCHGGDPTESDKEAAHLGTLGPTSTASHVYYRNQPSMCEECHTAETALFRKSLHYGSLEDHVLAPSCSTCHQVMNRKPYYRELPEHTCKVCHYENNKQDLPLVTNQAKEILNRLNLAKGYLNWTAVYYRSKDWPDDSRARVEALKTRFRDAVAKIHKFHLRASNRDSVDLLTRLKLAFEQAEREETAVPGPSGTAPPPAQ